jgi:beta-lactamase class A
MENGEHAALHGQQRFPMQSVYKLPIAMALLQMVDRGKLTLDQKIPVGQDALVPDPIHSPIREQYPHGDVSLSVRDLLRYTIVESDGTASDVLLRLLGGPQRVTAYLRTLGVQDLMVATTEKAMAQSQTIQYRNWATPEGAIRLLVALQKGRGLSAASRTLLLGLMTETGTGPHRIRGLLPAGTIVAHKTGTSGTVDGVTRATNDVGLVTLPDGRHLAIAVFVSDTRADEATRDGVIARIARAAWDHWTNPQSVEP